MNHRYTGFTDSFYEMPVAPYGDMVKPAICTDCGAIVADRKAHDDWHETGIRDKALRKVAREIKRELRDRP